MQGRIQGFQKGGVETRETKCGGEGGGGGVLPALDPTRKAGGGGGGGVLSASGPIRKAGGGGGGCCPFKARYEKRRKGGGCCPALQARYKKRGRGRGCLAEEGALPYMKGGVATPKTPPPWIRLCYG